MGPRNLGKRKELKETRKGKRYPKPQAFKKDLKERQYQPFVCLAEIGIKKKTVSEFSGVFDPVKQTKRQENILYVLYTHVYTKYMFLFIHMSWLDQNLWNSCCLLLLPTVPLIHILPKDDQ